MFEVGSVVICINPEGLGDFPCIGVVAEIDMLYSRGYCRYVPDYGNRPTDCLEITGWVRPMSFFKLLKEFTKEELLTHSDKYVREYATKL